jgi:peroxiredoxin
LRQQQAELEKRHAQVLGISIDPVDENKAFRQKLRAGFPLLSDPGHKVGIGYTGTPEGGMDRPSVFLVDRQGRVAWRYLGDVSDRPPAAGVLKQLDLLAEAEKKDPDKAKPVEPCPTLKEPQSQ